LRRIAGIERIAKIAGIERVAKIAGIERIAKIAAMAIVSVGFVATLAGAWWALVAFFASPMVVHVARWSPLLFQSFGVYVEQSHPSL